MLTVASAEDKSVPVSVFIQTLNEEDNRPRCLESLAWSEDIVVDFTDWIRNGAPWPTDTPEATRDESKLRDYEYWRAEHWSWRPIATSSTPAPRARPRSGARRRDSWAARISRWAAPGLASPGADAAVVGL